MTEPGTYNVFASAEGYVGPGVLEPARRGVRIPPDRDGSAAEVYRIDLLLYRTAVVRGRLVDSQTKDAIAGVGVQLVQARIVAGELSLAPPGASGKTNAEGDFLFEKAPPGRYFIEIQSTVSESVSEPKPAEGTAGESRPRGYRRSYWPELELGYSAALKIPAGSHLDLGKIDVAGGLFHRIAGKIEFSNCAETDRFLVGLRQRFGGSHIIRARALLPCNSPFVIEGVGPGSYVVSGWVQGKALFEREYAEVPVMISEEDLEFTVQATTPRRLTGQMVFPPHFTGHERVRLRLLRVGSLPFADEVAEVRVDEHGRFTLHVVCPAESELMIQGIEPPYCIKEIVHNGAPLPAHILTFDPYVPSHHVEVTVSDKAAAFEGSVTADGDPAPGAHVLISRWPLAFKGVYPIYVSSVTDDRGRFSKPGLAAGRYRVVVAAAAAMRGRLQQRQDAIEALSSGKEIELGEGEARSVALEVSVW